MRFGRIAWRIPLLAMAVIAWSAPANAETRTVTAPTDYWFTFTEPTVFSARTFSQSDPHLWLYREDGTLVAANDDYYGLDSYLLVPVQSGTYRLRVGVCCGDPDRWYGGGFQVDFDHNPVEPTTTTLPEETTTTWEPTTTSTAPETTVTTTAPTSVAPVTETPTTEATTTEPSPPPSTASETSSVPSSDWTDAPSTTNPPATSVAPTSSPIPSFAPPAGTTTSLAPPPTVSVTSSSTSPASTSTIPTTDPTTSTMPSSDSSPESVIPPPANNAPEQEKRAFEEEVNIFGDPAYDTYIPAGSTISVAERRTIIAATTATAFVLPTPTNRRRQK